jgi:hypothetical protein
MDIISRGTGVVTYDQVPSVAPVLTINIFNFIAHRILFVPLYKP